MIKKYSCACCGYLTLSEKAGSGSFEICSVCFWEDDPVQFNDINYVGGANSCSLKQARENYRSFGACDKSSLPYVRLPLLEEFHDKDPQEVIIPTKLDQDCKEKK